VTSEPARRERAISKETILSLYLPAVMLSLGEGIAAPVLPQLAKSFDVSLGTALLIVFVQQWGSVVSTFPTGYLVDRVGRRPIILLGPVLTALAAFLTAFAWSFAALLVFRFLHGVAAQMWQQSRLAMIADTGGDRERGKLITWMSSFQRFGQLFAPALGGLAAVYNLRAPFILEGILVLLCVVPCYLLVKETRPERQPAVKGDGDWGFIFSELRKPQMLWFLAAQVFANLTRGNIQAVMNIYMSFAYGRSPQSLGLINSATGISSIPIGFMTGTIMDRYGRKKTIVPGFIGLFLSAALLAYTAIDQSPFWFFLIGYFLLISSQSITGGNMQVLGSDLAPARARGRFIGIWRFLAALGNAGSPAMFSLLTFIGYAASFSFLSVCALAVALIVGFKVQETMRARVREVAPEPGNLAADAASAGAVAAAAGVAATSDVPAKSDST
jgi:MFS family permease